MTIEKMLDIPDPRLEHGDIKLLEAYPAKDRPFGMALVAYPHGSGWTVSSQKMLEPGEKAAFVESARKEGFSDKFIGLLELAAENDARLVRLNGPEGPRKVQTILDLSTEHVTSKDAEILETYPADDVRADRPLAAHPFEYGYTVSTAPLMDPDARVRAAFVDAVRAEGFSDAFVRLMEKAADMGVAMVRLDQDMEPSEDFDLFSWEKGDVQVDHETGEPVGSSAPTP
jgi:hypothetical protein